MTTEARPSFTPGPWHIAKQASGTHGSILVGPDDRSFAFLSCFGDDSEADAHLIAAAPELYAALRQVMFDLSRIAPDDDYLALGSWNDARAALAKADGR